MRLSGRQIGEKLKRMLKIFLNAPKTWASSLKKTCLICLKNIADDIRDVIECNGKGKDNKGFCKKKNGGV